jgi:hypothetical protein
VFADHSLAREPALRRINEAIQQSVVRLRRRGLPIHATAVPESGKTKLLVDGSVEVK